MPNAAADAIRTRRSYPMAVRNRQREWRGGPAVVAFLIFATLVVIGVGLWAIGPRGKPLVGDPPATATPTAKVVEYPPPVNPKPGDPYVLRYGDPPVEMRFRWCPPGTFDRGDDAPGRRGDPWRDNEKPVRNITISKGFWTAETECTQAQWRPVMPANPGPSHFKGDNLPVEQVSALDADEFCRALAGLTGLPVRLPTEAEWEYACRAGTTTEYYSGDGRQALGKVGWCDDNAGRTTHPVGELPANGWGLTDMHGNVWEWVQDGYDPEFYAKSSTINPICTSYQHHYRVIRGGGWDSLPDASRAAYRNWQPPSIPRQANFGFRVCLRPD